MEGKGRRGEKGIEREKRRERRGEERRRVERRGNLSTLQYRKIHFMGTEINPRKQGSHSSLHLPRKSVALTFPNTLNT